MNVIWMIFLTALALGAAIYAQQQIPRFTARPRAALLTRVGLLLLGLVFGYVVADNFSSTNAPGVLTFLIGFGAVHVPPALILLIKRAAGAGKS